MPIEEQHHDPAFISVKFDKVCDIKHVYNSLDFSKADYVFINSKFRVMDWDFLLSAVEQNVSFFYNQINNMISLHVPIRKCRSPSDTYPEWYSDELI